MRRTHISFAGLLLRSTRHAEISSGQAPRKWEQVHYGRFGVHICLWIVGVAIFFRCFSEITLPLCDRHKFRLQVYHHGRPDTSIKHSHISEVNICLFICYHCLYSPTGQMIWSSQMLSTPGSWWPHASTMNFLAGSHVVGCGTILVSPLKRMRQFSNP